MTRVYLPRVQVVGLACRSCWGLTYDSRAQHTYRDSPHGRGAWAKGFGVTQRDWAYMETDRERERRAEAARSAGRTGARS